MTITGPARNLTRMECREAKVGRIASSYGKSGEAQFVQVRFVRTADGKQIMLELTEPEWQSLRERIDRAFVF
jgi:hypothetical protein